MHRGHYAQAITYKICIETEGIDFDCINIFKGLAIFGVSEEHLYTLSAITAFQNRD